MIDYEYELNPAQLEAVRYCDGPSLVIAGAGSGKTRVFYPTLITHKTPTTHLHFFSSSLSLLI